MKRTSSSRKRPVPSSFDNARRPKKRACYFSRTSNQYEHSPCSSSHPRAIPDYFPNYATCHLTFSPHVNPPNAYYPVSRVQNEHTFSQSCSFYDENYRNVTQHTLLPCSSSNGSNRRQPGLLRFDSMYPIRRHFFDFARVNHNGSMNPESRQFCEFSSVPHNTSLIPRQHTLPPRKSFGNIELGCGSVTSLSSRQFFDFSSATRNGFLTQQEHALSPRGSFDNIQLGLGSAILNRSDNTNSPAISLQSLLLAELEFRKLFLVHSYVGRKKLEDVISAEDAIEIISMKSLPMFDFEAIIWAKYGTKFCESSDRAMHLDWDSGKTYLYHCNVCADGTYYFKGPYLNTRRTHLQRELGDDNVLIVQFTDDSIRSNWNAAYKRISKGISVGLRDYRLFAFKDTRGDKKNIKVHDMNKVRSTWAIKCYFVRKESHAPWAEKDYCILFHKTSHGARCLFMHVHMVATMPKYISRCSLALSSTVKLHVDLASVNVQRIEDIPCRDGNGFVVYDENGELLIHTDGTGFISEDLAILCAKDFMEAKGTKDYSYEFFELLKLEEELLRLKDRESCIKEAPLLVQCRLFIDGYAIKGTLLVNRKLKSRTIQIRPSMIKVEKDTRLSNSTYSSLEICSISRRPRKVNLSRNLIALLTVGGVPKEYFLCLLKTTLQDANKVFSSIRAAVRVILKYGYLDDSAISAAMIKSGIPLGEPYLQYHLSYLANEERKGLHRGKIPLNDSFYLMGTADPTGTLNSDEVCIILENFQISGKVLVYRNPGLHFGDIHILNAKYVKEMEDFVGNAKYGIFFSTKGKRSVVSEMANGDFDGDLYWVSRSPRLLHYFKASDPWERIYSTPNVFSKKPSELSCEELENEVYTLLFATQKQNVEAGKAANSWLTFMDQYLSLGEDDVDDKNWIREKLLKLVDLFYDALDAPKTGKTVEIPDCLLPQKYPHYLEKTPDKTFQSSSVLGEIYDTAKAYQPDTSLIQDIWKLPCFNVHIPDASFHLWKDRYKSYRQEMADALQSGDESKKDSANIVIKKYKQMLYEADNFATSRRKIEDIYNESLAIYHAAYNHAQCLKDVKKCGFAWKVAGEALCSLHDGRFLSK